MSQVTTYDVSVWGIFLSQFTGLNRANALMLLAVANHHLNVTRHLAANPVVSLNLAFLVACDKSILPIVDILSSSPNVDLHAGVNKGNFAWTSRSAFVFARNAYL